MGATLIVNNKLGNKFVIIIDEWDVLIRDDTNIKIQKEYIDFLRGLFKGNEPTKYIALAYMTGILPIVKEKAQSALNNFTEFTMLAADELSSFIGFTEDEVRDLCERYNRDFDEVKRWYDGYLLDNYHVYNPRAVVRVMANNKFRSYWSDTSTFEAIKPLINGMYPGLKENILDILFGKRVEVDVTLYQNKLTFNSKEDVLTYMIHLGYLAYNQDEKTAYYPNEEVRLELLKAVKNSDWDEYNQFYKDSLDLLQDTIEGNSEAVSKRIEDIHDRYVPSIEYNDENSLSCVLTIAYLASMKYYETPIREFPGGKGFADYVFIPKQLYMNSYPALVVELKWNKDAITAIQQIQKKEYPKPLLKYVGKILLVGMNYDKKVKKHTCLIEELRK